MVDGIIFFSYMMLAGSIILGFGSKNYLWFRYYDDAIFLEDFSSIFRVLYL